MGHRGRGGMEQGVSGGSDCSLLFHLKVKKCNTRVDKIIRNVSFFAVSLTIHGIFS